LRKHLKFIALVLLAGLILWWFGRGLDWAEVRRSISQADGRLLALAIALISTTYLLRAYRWRALLTPLAPASIRELFVATTVGFSAIFGFGRAGEVVRGVMLPLREPRVRPAASFVTLMVERLCDTVAVAVLFALSLMVVVPPTERVASLAQGARVATLIFTHGRLAGLCLLAVAALMLLVLAWFRRRSQGAIGWLDEHFARWHFVPARLSRAVVSVLEQLASALRILVNAHELGIVAGWTAVLWFVIVVADWLVLRAFGLPFGLEEAVFVMGCALVGSLVPTPAGAAGPFHAATIIGLEFLDVKTEKAAAVAFVMHLVVFAPSLIFGFYYFLRGEIDIKRLRRLASSEEVEHAVEDEKIDAPVMTTDEMEMVGVNE
jgi:glycosyltransferase 2 family protein